MEYVPKDSFSSYDQMKGKAERRAKKALYEYLTGCDLGDADEDSSTPEPVANAAHQIAMPAAPQPQTQRSAMENAGAQAESDWRKKANSGVTSTGPDF